MAATARLKECRDLLDALENRRRPREDEWRDIREFILPHRGLFERDGGERVRRGRNIINGAATQAVRKAASGLTSGMTPEGVPWFRFGFTDAAMDERTGARPWLDSVEARLYWLLRATGFYQSIQACNEEYLAFSPLLLFQDNDPARICRFECVTCGTYAVGLGADGYVDTVARRIRWTAHQLRDRFGEDSLSRAVRRKLAKASSSRDPVEVVHLVRPRLDRDPRKADRRNMPFESTFFEAEASTSPSLAEGGYREMPYAYTAFTDSLPPYGYGPGHVALGDAAMLQELEKDKLVAQKKVTNPPMLVPSTYKARLNAAPGGETPIGRADMDMVRPLYEVRPDIRGVAEEIARVEARLNDTLLASLFADMPLGLRPADMTWGEYLERKRERLQLMGPALSAYEPQVLDRVLARSYAMLDRAGELPPPPPGLGEVALVDVQYISPLAQAMRQTGADSTRSIVRDALELASVHPEVLDKLDLDQAVDEMARGAGAPGRVVRSDEEVAAIRKARAEQQRKAEQAANAMQTMETLSRVAATPTGPGTLAGDLAGKVAP